MKNYFTSVAVSRNESSPVRLASCLAELVDQLRYTVNNLDLDNMTPDTIKSLRSCKVHIKTENDITSGRMSEVKKGDIVIVPTNENGGLVEASRIYFCTKDIGTS